MYVVTNREGWTGPFTSEAQAKAWLRSDEARAEGFDPQASSVRAEEVGR